MFAVQAGTPQIHHNIRREEGDRIRKQCSVTEL